jgi:predicted helicase
MGSIHEVIDAFRQEPSNSERGTKFEQLMVRYFQLDPMLSQQYDQVCRWVDWPGRDGKIDTGIDLVARARDTGEYTAVQCKFYEPTTTLAKGDIDSFFTASGKKPFTNRIIISTTDRWGKNAEEAPTSAASGPGHREGVRWFRRWARSREADHGMWHRQDVYRVEDCRTPRHRERGFGAGAVRGPVDRAFVSDAA